MTPLLWWLLLAFAASQTLGNMYWAHVRRGFSELATWIAILVPFSIVIVMITARVFGVPL